jgi:hypothetical protein
MPERQRPISSAWKRLEPHPHVPEHEFLGDVAGHHESHLLEAHRELVAVRELHHHAKRASARNEMR